MDFISAIFELEGGESRSYFPRPENVPGDSLDRVEQYFLKEQIDLARKVKLLALALPADQNPRDAIIFGAISDALVQAPPRP